MAVTTPPFTLLLGGVEVVGIAWRVAARPGRALRNTPLRFGLLLTACLTVPPLAVAALGAHTYGGWRHLYFLHAPLCLLAAGDAAWARRGAYAAAGVAAAGILIAMARIHPLQHVYFNFLVDRTTPERLRTQYEMDSGGTADLGALNHLPDDRVQYGFDNLDFNLLNLTLFDRKCLVTVRLPEYAVEHVRTGQFRMRRTREGVRYENVWAGSFSPGDLDGAVGGEPPR